VADPVRDYALDENGDYLVVDGDYVFISGAAAVKQGIRIRILTWLKEIFLNQSLGVDYRDSILIKGADPLVVRALIAEQILAVPDVLEVRGAQLVVDANREASIHYVYRDVYSTIPVEDAVKIR